MKDFSRAECISFAVLSSTLSSVGTLFKVQGVKTLPPVLAATVGVLFAGLISTPYLLIRGQFPKWKAIRSVLYPLLMLTLCRPIIANILFTIGLSLTSGVKAVFLTKMEPYLVIFWVWFLDGKRPSGRHLWLLLIHIIGAILLSAGDTTQVTGAQWGDLIIIISVITAALSYRFAPQVTKVLNPMQASTISETLGGLVTLPFVLVFFSLRFTPEDLVAWYFIAVHALLFYVIAIPLLYASLHGIESWLSSALRATGPLVAVPIAMLLFGERLSSVQIFGGLIVLITSALISRAEKKTIRPLEE